MAYIPPSIRAGALRLHFNENTAGCSPAVLAAIHAITREDAAFYPDYEPITAKVAERLGVPATWVLLTNGLDEGLHVAAQWAARAGVHGGRQRAGLKPGPTYLPTYAPTEAQTSATIWHALITEPAFEMYEACTEILGGEMIRVAPEPDFSFPLGRVLSAMTATTRLVYLTDPNNPTGIGIPAGAVEAIADAAPNAMILVDEAYSDFSGRTLIGPLLERLPRVVIGRTFAKAYGLAALRVGAVIAHPDTIGALRRLLPPFSLNICAIRALDAALDDRGYLEWYVGQASTSKALIYEFCQRTGLQFWTSEANFVLMRVGGDVAALTSAMADRGVLVRDKSRAPGCAGYIRFTAGVVDHTTFALATLEDVLASRSH
jgi:histidinol-phosphate aminotransferase